MVTLSSVTATTSRYLRIKIIDTNVIKIGYKEHPLTASRFLCIFLLLLVSETQSNLWNQNNLTRPVINSPENFSFIFFQKLSIRTGRQCLRIDAVRRSPINSHVDESLAGATSIRAFNAQGRFIQKMDRLVDESQAASYLSMIVLR